MCTQSELISFVSDQTFSHFFPALVILKPMMGNLDSAAGGVFSRESKKFKGGIPLVCTGEQLQSDQVAVNCDIY